MLKKHEVINQVKIFNTKKYKLLKPFLEILKSCLKLWRYGTAQFKLYTPHACTCFTCVKVYNVECIFFVACKFFVHTHPIKQWWHTRNTSYKQTRHERTLS